MAKDKLNIRTYGLMSLTALLLLVLGFGIWQVFDKLNNNRQAELPNFVSNLKGLRGVQNLTDTNEQFSGLASDTPGFLNLVTDGKSLVGVRMNSTKSAIASLMIFDLASKKAQTLKELNDVTVPQISNRFIVWAENSAFMIYDREKQVISSPKLLGKGARLSFSDPIMAWVNFSADGRPDGIHGYNVDTGKEFVITNKNASELQIAGQWVAYSAFQKINIVNTETSVSQELGQLPNPTGYVPGLFAVGKKYAIWVNWEGRTGKLNIFDFLTQHTKSLDIPNCGSVQNPGYPSHLRVSDSFALISGCGKASEVGYDFESSKFFDLSMESVDKSPTMLADWAISDKTVIWTLFSSGQTAQKKTQIYSAEIDSSAKSSLPDSYMLGVVAFNQPMDLAYPLPNTTPNPYYPVLPPLQKFPIPTPAIWPTPALRRNFIPSTERDLHMNW